MQKGWVPTDYFRRKGPFLFEQGGGGPLFGSRELSVCQDVFAGTRASGFGGGRMGV